MAIDQDTVAAAGMDPFAKRLAILDRQREGYETQDAALGEQKAALGAEGERLIAARGQALQPVRAKLTEKIENVPTATTKEEPIPQYQRPTVKPQELNEAFGMMMAASMLVGAGSRTPFHGVMNAMTGAMNGFVKQDQVAVEESLKIFDKDMATIKERNAQLHRRTEEAYKTWERDFRAGKQEYELIAAEYDDPIALNLAREGKIDAARKQLESRITSIDNAANRLVTTRAQLDDKREARADRREMHNETLADRRQARADRAGAGGGAAGAGGPDATTVQFLAEKYLKEGGKALTGLGYGRAAQPLRDAIFKRAQEITTGQGQSGADVAGAQAGFAADASSLKQYQNYVNRIEALGSKIDKDINTLFTVAEKGVGPTKLPVFDKFLQSGRKALGDPDVSAFETQIQTVKNEYGRSMSGPASNAQLHVSAMQHADDLINSAQNLDQLKAVVNIMRRDIKNQRDVAEEQIGAIKSRLSGRRADDPAPATAPSPPPAPRSSTRTAAPPTNAKGWKLHTDKQGNQAYVSPDGKQFEEVR